MCDGFTAVDSSFDVAVYTCLPPPILVPRTARMRRGASEARVAEGCISGARRRRLQRPGWLATDMRALVISVE